MKNGEANVVTGSGNGAVGRLDALVKVGVKGPGVRAWAERLGVAFPAKLYDCLMVEGAVVARVGGDELIVEGEAENSLVAKLRKGLVTAEAGVYRIEQQSATFVLRGEKGEKILLQTCGVEMAAEPVGRIVYTRVAGVSCGMIPMEEGGRSYRLWCDYTLAPYLWENLCTIVAELE